MNQNSEKETTQPDKDEITGLEGAEEDTSSEDQTEWEKDDLLIELETKFNNIRKGAFAGYGKYVLPIGLAFTLSGAMVNIAVNSVDNRDSTWMALSLTGNIFLIVGIIAVIFVLMLIAFDHFRRQYIESFDGEKLAEFECVHFENINEDNRSISKCAYFDRVLDDDPICLICPVYQTKNEEKN